MADEAKAAPKTRKDLLEDLFVLDERSADVEQRKAMDAAAYNDELKDIKKDRKDLVEKIKETA